MELEFFRIVVGLVILYVPFLYKAVIVTLLVLINCFLIIIFLFAILCLIAIPATLHIVYVEFTEIFKNMS